MADYTPESLKLQELVDAGILPADKYASYLPSSQPPVSQTPDYLAVSPPPAPDPTQQFQGQLDELVNKKLNFMSPGQTPQDLAQIRSQAEQELLDQKVGEKKSADAVAAQDAQLSSSSQSILAEKAKADAAALAAENEKRALVGLPPKPAPAGADQLPGSQARPSDGPGSAGVQLPQPQGSSFDGQMNNYFNQMGNVAKIEGQGFAQMEKGIRSAAAAGAAKAAATQGYVDQWMHQDQKRQADVALAEADRNGRLEDGYKKLEDLSRGYQDAAAKGIDPGHFWSSRSTDQKVLAGIGLLLGAFGAYTNKGQNPAVQVIDNAIDRDIEAQKLALDAKGRAVDAQRGVLGDMMKMFGDRRVAEQAARAVAYDRVEMLLKAQAAKYEGTAAAAQAQIQLGELQLKRAQAYKEFLTTYMASPGMIAQDERTREALMKARVAGVPQEKVLEELEKQRLHEKASDQLKKNFQIANENTGGVTSLSPQASSLAEAAKANSVPILKQIYGRAPNKEEIEAFEQTFPHKLDSTATRAMKLKMQQDFLESHRPELPHLSLFGMTEKPKFSLAPRNRGK